MGDSALGATRTARAVAGRDAAMRAFAAEGCSPPRSWSNDPGDTYGRHSHGHHMVLFCLAGSITFHLGEDDVRLQAGARLDLAPGTDHAATVGDGGCACVEASR
jgi:mannose-6-phosphate isomerase-like protein (cupin superfamily)